VLPIIPSKIPFQLKVATAIGNRKLQRFSLNFEGRRVAYSIHLSGCEREEYVLLKISEVEIKQVYE
jgi:hypothetical protein